MEIRLDLSRHCIETAARLKVEKLIRSYFKTQCRETDRQIRALTRFLERADFGRLRCAMAPAKGKGPRTALLSFPADTDQMEVRFKDQVLHPLSGQPEP